MFGWLVQLPLGAYSNVVLCAPQVGPTAMCTTGVLARRCHYGSRVGSRGRRWPCHCLRLRHLDIRRRHTAAVAASTCLFCFFSRLWSPFSFVSWRARCLPSFRSRAALCSASGCRIRLRWRSRRRFLAFVRHRPCRREHNSDCVPLPPHGGCTSFFAEEDGATEILPLPAPPGSAPCRCRGAPSWPHHRFGTGGSRNPRRFRSDAHCSKKGDLDKKMLAPSMGVPGHLAYM